MSILLKPVCVPKRIGTGRYDFVTHSFLTGMGSVLNISGNYYRNDFRNPEDSGQRDTESIFRDWMIISDDLKQEINVFDSGYKKLIGALLR